MRVPLTASSRLPARTSVQLTRRIALLSPAGALRPRGQCAVLRCIALRSHRGLGSASVPGSMRKCDGGEVPCTCNIACTLCNHIHQTTNTPNKLTTDPDTQSITHSINYLLLIHSLALYSPLFVVFSLSSALLVCCACSLPPVWCVVRHAYLCPVCPCRLRVLWPPCLASRSPGFLLLSSCPLPLSYVASALLTRSLHYSVALATWTLLQSPCSAFLRRRVSDVCADGP